MSGKFFRRVVIALSVAFMVSLPLATEAQAATPTYGAAALQVAKVKVGASYSYGAAGPYRFDCSGLSQYSYEHSKHKHYLPRTAEAQYKYAKKIAWQYRKPGDLVFFHARNGYVIHVGVYVGLRKQHGKVYSYMIHAPKPGSHVKYENINEHWGYSYVTYGRI